MEIGTLGPTDADAALRLSRQAGWGMRQPDWDLLLAADATVAVGGWHENALVATATVAQYGDLGWVGCVLVDDAYRRQGWGTTIFTAAVQAADAALLGLDANPAGKPIYKDQGFVEITTVRQYEGRPTPAYPPQCSELKPSDMNELIQFDRERTGVDRGWLLRALSTTSDTHAFVHRDGDLTGYALLHPDRDGWNLGPVVADIAESAHALIRRAAAEVNDTVTVRVPTAPTVGDVNWDELGFTFERALDRMVCPPRGAPLAGGAVRASLAYAFG